MPVPSAAYRKLIQVHGTNVDVDRRDDTTDSQYGNELTYSDLGQRYVLVAGFEESNQQVSAGERQAQRMTIYSHAETDLQVNDRVTIDNEVYEIIASEELPRADATITRYELDNDF